MVNGTWKMENITIKQLTDQDRKEFNKVVSHPLQSWEWGEFRKKTHVKVIRRGVFEKDTLVDGFQLTIHPIPHTPWTIGYVPKGNLPTDEILNEMQKIGKEEKCIFIQLEPNVRANQLSTLNFPLSTFLVTSAHPLFTKYTFILDLTKSEEEILKDMHSKTRYNIKIATRHNVEIKEDNSEAGFKRFLELNRETNTRQKFYSRPDWHFQEMQQMFSHPKKENSLQMQLLSAKYQGKTLAAWILFVFKDTLYYPYGASSSENREVMASNLMMWEAIKLGKKLGLQKFDMWGAMGPNPDSKDPWFGFHTFKERYGPEHVEFIGSYDLIINKPLYEIYKVMNKLRWLYLRLKK